MFGNKDELAALRSKLNSSIDLLSRRIETLEKAEPEKPQFDKSRCPLCGRPAISTDVKTFTANTFWSFVGPREYQVIERETITYACGTKRKFVNEKDGDSTIEITAKCLKIK